LALTVVSLAGSSAQSQDGARAVADQDPKHKPWRLARHRHDRPGQGTLGYGPPGLHPGFQGFGLGYHRGYGYGGKALGVGADGGYPYFGGPGYPHCAPELRRLGPIAPFPFYGGPGYPTPDHPNSYSGVGPLVANRPVVEIEAQPGEVDYRSGYGAATGAIPYPESFLAPFTTRAGTLGSSGSPARGAQGTP
jgi:hypothetical protein